MADVLIRETIVTTLPAGADAVPHVAPMGLRQGDDGLWLLAPFRPSRTLDNVLATRQAVVNFVDDVRVFAGCMTGRSDWPCVPAQYVAGCRLGIAASHLELELERIDESAGRERPKLWLREVHRATHRPFDGFVRARAAVIEACVLVSRLEMLPARKIDDELAWLAIAIERTAGPAEREAWDWLMERIAQHRAGRRDAGLKPQAPSAPIGGEPR